MSLTWRGGKSVVVDDDEDVVICKEEGEVSIRREVPT